MDSSPLWKEKLFGPCWDAFPCLVAFPPPRMRPPRPCMRPLPPCMRGLPLLHIYSHIDRYKDKCLHTYIRQPALRACMYAMQDICSDCSRLSYRHAWFSQVYISSSSDWFWYCTLYRPFNSGFFRYFFISTFFISFLSKCTIFFVRWKVRCPLVIHWLTQMLIFHI
jgi:hypothetical protein